MVFPYSERGMSPARTQLPAPSPRFLMEIMVLGSVTGTLLILLEAPLWLFYVAPVLGVPPLIRRLRDLDRPPHVRHGSDAAQDQRGSGIGGLVLLLLGVGLALLDGAPLRLISSQIESSSPVVQKVGIAPALRASSQRPPEALAPDRRMVERSGGERRRSVAVSENSPDSGSSPFVPILISMAVLATVSIGAVMYRHGKSRSRARASRGLT